MLKQILKEMYVDPEILIRLDDTQKQTLFCKMREEQIRQWRIWDQKYEKLGHQPHKKLANNSVVFRLGEDGEPWVWVMGEHENDRTIDNILADEAKQRARELAEIETKELRKSYELSGILEYDANNSSKSIENNCQLIAPQIKEMEIYCSVDELRERVNLYKLNDTQKNINFMQYKNTFNLNSNQSYHVAVLQEISNKSEIKVSDQIELWEKRVICEKTNEIYKQLKRKQQEKAKEAEKDAQKCETLWQEQERKAKEAEIHIREIARCAREKHRKSINGDEVNENSSKHRFLQIDKSTPLSSLDFTSLRPSSQDAVINWYRHEEFYKGCGIDFETGKPFSWFHGLVTRDDAEHLLSSEPAGTFLIRLSEKIWGYAISYKDCNRIKHYLVDASNGTYHFLGPNQLSHDSLDDLVRFHATVPITVLGNELLTKSCSAILSIPNILQGLI